MTHGRQPTVFRVAEHYIAVGTVLLHTGMYPFRFSAKQMLFVRVSAGSRARQLAFDRTCVAAVV
jgi:hypothetical protein